jgi:putative nucleotidyltransferase with HDIG domain
VTENDKLFDTLEMLNRHSNWLYAHCLGVSIYSVMIGRKLGWKGQSTLFRLAIGGLLHDIGEKELPIELITKPREQMTQEERKLFETHATRSKDLLLNCGLSEDIIQIVYEHHEEGSGQGYPRRITKQKMHPLARVVSLADKFCYHVVKSPLTTATCAPETALARILAYHDDIDQKEVAALKSICKSELATEKSS